MDILMPDLSGFEVLEKLHADKETRNIPVIVLTVKDLTSEESEMLKSHAVAVMKKTSFKREGFMLKVGNILSLEGK